MFITKEGKMERRKIKPLSLHQKMTIQLWLGVCLVVVGVLLLWCSFFVTPLGVIDASVLAAVGEVFTFAGALIGIDYTYKYKVIRHLNYREEDIDDTESTGYRDKEEGNVPDNI